MLLWKKPGILHTQMYERDEIKVEKNNSKQTSLT